MPCGPSRISTQSALAPGMKIARDRRHQPARPDRPRVLGVAARRDSVTTQARGAAPVPGEPLQILAHGMERPVAGHRLDRLAGHRWPAPRCPAAAATRRPGNPRGPTTACRSQVCAGRPGRRPARHGRGRELVVPQHVLPFRRLAQGVDRVGEDQPSARPRCCGASQCATRSSSMLGVDGGGDRVGPDRILAAFDEHIVEILAVRRLGHCDLAPR